MNNLNGSYIFTNKNNISKAIDLFIKNLHLFISNKKLVNQIDKDFGY